MSYAPTNHSWYTSKNNAVPGHPGPIPHLYNPSLGANSTQQQPPPAWNNGVQQQQQPYWQSNAPAAPQVARPPSVNQVNAHPAADNSWNWGTQTPYQPPQHQQVSMQHQHHQQQPQYSQPTPASYHPNNTDPYFYGNANTQPAIGTNSDPWNWGTEDSSSSEGVSNNNMDAADPTWNWSVDHQQQQQQQQQLPNAYVPPPSPGLQEAFSASSTNYSPRDVDQHFQVQPETKHSSMSLSNHSEASGTGSYESVNLQQSSSSQLASGTASYESVNLQQSSLSQLASGTGSYESANLRQSSSSQLLQPVPSTNHFGGDSKDQLDETGSNVGESVQSAYVPAPHVDHASTLGDASLRVHALETSSEATTVIADARHENGTELERLELSVSSVSRHDRQVMAADGLLGDRLELEFSLTSRRGGSTALTPQWSTESLPSQGSDEVSRTLDGGGRNDFAPSPLSAVSQSPLLTDGNYDPNRFDSFGSYHDTPSPEDPDPPPPATPSRSVEDVRRQMTHLRVDADVGTRPEETDNREVVAPETTALVPPPPMQAPPPFGPPPAGTTAPVNPYAGGKISPRSAGKYRGASLPVGPPREPDPLPPAGPRQQPPPYGDVNLETLPDNEERPDVVRSSLLPADVPVASTTSGQEGVARQRATTTGAYVSASPENQEVAAPRCGPDRNQYLETGELSDNEGYRPRDTGGWSRPRTVPGDVSTPPPGLERTVPGGAMTNGGTPGAGEDIPPPGLRRMVPGESSSPESQGVGSSQPSNTFQPIGSAPMETRVVTGVSREEVDGQGSTAPTSNSRSPSPTPDQSSSSNNNNNNNMTTQPTAERSETIGSDSVETYPPPPADNTSRDVSSSNRRENPKERERRHREDEPVDERDGRRRANHGHRDREREDSPPPRDKRDAPDRRGDGKRREESPSPRDPDRRGDGKRREESPSPRDPDRRGDGKRREESPPPRDPDRRGDGKRREESPPPRDPDRRGDGKRREESPPPRDPDRRGDGKRREESPPPRDPDRRGDGKRRERPKSTRERGERRRDESPDSRRYREERPKERKRYDTRDGYGNYRSTEDRRRYGRRTDYRDTDTGSEYSDYDRRDYDRRGYDRRDYDRRDKAGYRGREDRYRADDGRRYRTSHHDRSKPDKRDHHRPESREPTQFVPPLSGFHGLNGRTIAEYLNYYSNLRSYDAVAYADWYNNVYKSMSYQQPMSMSYGEDRGSVHSGRSSANSGIYRDRFERSGVHNATDYYRRSPVSLGSSDRRLSRELEQTTTSLTEDRSAASPHRLTPSKYVAAHVKGVLTRRGQLVKVLPHYPLDGQSGVVEIHDIQGLFASDEVRRELDSYPGPLVKGVTHKNSLIAFCNSKIKSAESNTELFDRESVILLWRLLILLLRQNGTVVGIDIAELLLSDGLPLPPTRPSASSTPASHLSRDEAQPDETVVTGNNRSVFNVKTEEELTNSFREFLLYGNTREALEWAMKNGLWGHALFLASKMDQRTYASVMTRFANGLTMNDPLQTLYQLMSGRQPAAVTCCADERWGDWKPHLAMILSNSSSQRLELNHKSITTLGDTLGARGCLHAAHFTYLMAQVDFGTYSQKAAKVVLLGSSHHRSFLEFATNEAIQMTEIYEYACKLAEPEFTIRPLQAFKLLYAKRLAEQGMVAEAMQYAEELGSVLLRHPEHYAASLVADVYDLGDSLKYNDPLYNCCPDDDGTEGSRELQWLGKLKRVIADMDSGAMQQDVTSYGSVSNLSYTEGENFQHAGIPTLDPASQVAEPVSYDYNWQQQQLQQQQYTPQAYLDPMQEHRQQQHLEQQPNEMADAFQPPQANQGQPQQEWPTTPQSISQWDTQGNSTMIPDSNQQQQQQQQQQQPYSNYWDQSTAHEEQPAPQISLPNSVPERSQKTRDTDTQPKPSAKTNQKKDSSNANTGNGWFGGLWNKLALRPKNQMKLPDDKNPTIVWDSDRKRWTNLDADGEESSSELAPPPKMVPNSIPSMPAPQSAAPNHTGGDHPQTNSLPPPMSAPNMYKMNRGRSLRSNYVDVLGGNKPSSQSAPPPADIFPPVATSTPQNMNFFVPGASAEVMETVPADYMSANPAPVPSHEPTTNQHDMSTQHLSRWSSTSSLSREVQSYTMRGRHSVGPKGSEAQNQGYPFMIDPSKYAQPIPYTANSSSNQFKNRYPHK